MTQPSPNPPPGETPIRARHFRAPHGDGEALIESEFAEAPQLLLDNRRKQCESQIRLFDVSHQQAAGDARFELIRTALGFSESYRAITPRPRHFSSTTPVVLSGHQPEFFHPGVWLKNFVLSECTNLPNSLEAPPIPGIRTPTFCINLVIDNDT